MESEKTTNKNNKKEIQRTEYNKQFFTNKNIPIYGSCHTCPMKCIKKQK